MNPLNTVFDFKRLLGLRFSDPAVQSLAATWPFRVVRGEDDEPLVEVTCRGDLLRLSPVQLTGMFLGHLRTLAELHLRGPISRAVVTVPCSGSPRLRAAISDACCIARLAPVIESHYSSSAATRHYAALQAVRNRGSGQAVSLLEPRLVVLVDIGASGCEIIVADFCEDFAGVDHGAIEVLSHAHSTGFGGSQVDAALMEVRVYVT